MSVNQINHHGAEGQEAGDEHVKEEEHELSRVDGDFKEIPSIAITIDQPKLATWRLVALPGIAMLGMIAQTSSIIGVSLCLRPMSQELSIPTYALQWLLTSASLAFVCTLLFFGRISDIYGHKAFFIIGLSWAALFNLACALAQTSVQFFIFRSMTGLGFAWSVAFILPYRNHYSHRSPVARYHRQSVFSPKTSRLVLQSRALSPLSVPVLLQEMQCEHLSLHAQ